MKRLALFFCGAATVGIATAQQTTKFEPYETTLPGSTISFRMQPIPAGQFLMGSTDKEAGRNADEGPQKNVKISAFWMGRYEVTYDEFLLFFNDESTSRNSEVDGVTRPTPQYIDLSWGMGKAGGFPVNSMSQRTALMYCRWLYKKTGVFYRLPTEAEWEYACRAGSNTAYYYGNEAKQLKDYGWLAANSKNKYQKVGQKKPNAWGLYDMIGNVAEWTLDHYNDKALTELADGATDPSTSQEDVYPKVVRGGGYLDKPEAARSAARGKSDPTWNKRDPQIPKSKWWLTDGMQVGFRLVRPEKAPTAEEAETFYKKILGN